ncbi:probable indole-3-pyruvate monooxygenase YUCCA10 [Primulina huaijiensis]|uniref:probable indole-3-pyruvate monooxygenase YUCCA10 n=1 Tax=Primulina huaijiensis TaxID=1492673 RepID=UPI003CC7492A
MAEQRVKETVVIIVGGGPSGLATAACLSNLSIPYILLEREDCVASIWKKYTYDRVHLHLAKQFCELPLLPIPSSYPTYLSRMDFVQYLNDYVSHFRIHPIFRQAVEAAAYDEVAGKWNVKARDSGTGSDEVKEYRSRFLVVATGESCDASWPEIEGLLSFTGEILHSTQYKTGEKFKDKSVLVVGSGNSGMEISLDLANYGADTSVVVRSPIHVLSRSMTSLGLVLLKYLSLDWVDSLLVLMSKIVYGDLCKYGIERPKEGPFAMKDKYGRYPVVDVGTYQKIKSRQIQVLPGINRIRGTNVLFQDGKESAFDAIVLATGFKRSTKTWLKGDDYLLGDNGLSKLSYPNHWKGLNGLYCSGLARKGLYGAAMDAQNIAQDINTVL